MLLQTTKGFDWFSNQVHYFYSGKSSERSHHQEYQGKTYIRDCCLVCLGVKFNEFLWKNVLISFLFFCEKSYLHFWFSLKKKLRGSREHSLLCSRLPMDTKNSVNSYLLKDKPCRTTTRINQHHRIQNPIILMKRKTSIVLCQVNFSQGNHMRLLTLLMRPEGRD